MIDGGGNVISSRSPEELAALSIEKKIDILREDLTNLSNRFGNVCPGKEGPVILVLYIKISMTWSRQTVMECLRNAADRLEREFGPANNGKTMIIPITDGESRVECVNPAIMTRKNFNDVKRYLNHVAAGMNQLMNEMAAMEYIDPIEPAEPGTRQPQRWEPTGPSGEPVRVKSPFSFSKMIKKISSWPKVDPDSMNP